MFSKPLYPGETFPNFPDEALTDICKQLLDDWGLNPAQIANLAASIPGECKDIEEARDESAWEDQQRRLTESGSRDDSSYRRSLIEAGRGHLLR